MSKPPKRVKQRFFVTVEVEAEGWYQSDIEAARSKLVGQKDAQFPFFNSTCAGSDGSYNTKCLGVRKVTKAKEAK